MEHVAFEIYLPNHLRDNEIKQQGIMSTDSKQLSQKTSDLIGDYPMTASNVTYGMSRGLILPSAL